MFDIIYFLIFVFNDSAGYFLNLVLILVYDLILPSYYYTFKIINYKRMFLTYSWDRVPSQADYQSLLFT